MVRPSIFAVRSRALASIYETLSMHRQLVPLSHPLPFPHPPHKTLMQSKLPFIRQETTKRRCPLHGCHVTYEKKKLRVTWKEKNQSQHGTTRRFPFNDR